MFHWFNLLTPNIWLLNLPSSCNTSLWISYETLVVDQDNDFPLIILNILITCLLDNVWRLWGEVTRLSLLGVLISWMFLSSLACANHGQEHVHVKYLYLTACDNKSVSSGLRASVKEIYNNEGLAGFFR